VRKKRKRRGKTRIILLIALALLVAGFLTRRLLAPSLIRYSDDRPTNIGGAMPLLKAPGTSSGAASASEVSPGQVSPPSEAVTDADRHSLDDLIRKKTDQ